MSDDWGESFSFGSPHISLRVDGSSDSSEPPVKGKPTNPAQTKATAKTTSAPPPAVNSKKPTVVKSKWDGEDKEEDTPVVGLFLYNQ